MNEYHGEITQIKEQTLKVNFRKYMKGLKCRHIRDYKHPSKSQIISFCENIATTGNQIASISHSADHFKCILFMFNLKLSCF